MMARGTSEIPPIGAALRVSALVVIALGAIPWCGLGEARGQDARSIAIASDEPVPGGRR